MITNARKMACGGCGNGLFRMFADADGRGDLYAECTQCKSVSVITVEKPQISIEWAEGAKGVLCKMEPTMNKA